MRLRRFGGSGTGSGAVSGLREAFFVFRSRGPECEPLHVGRLGMLGAALALGLGQDGSGSTSFRKPSHCAARALASVSLPYFECMACAARRARIDRCSGDIWAHPSIAARYHDGVRRTEPSRRARMRDRRYCSTRPGRGVGSEAHFESAGSERMPSSPVPRAMTWGRVSGAGPWARSGAASALPNGIRTRYRSSPRKMASPTMSIWSKASRCARPSTRPPVSPARW
jgi:hypothetical protein